MKKLILLFPITLMFFGCQRLAMTPSEFNAEFKTETRRLTPEQARSGKYIKVKESNIRATRLSIEQDVHAAAEKVDDELRSMNAEAYTLDHFMWIPTSFGTELSIDFTGFKRK